MKRLIPVWLGIALFIGGAPGNHAVRAETKTVLMELKVLVDAPPPCTVTGSDVDFGDVIIKRVDGINYLMDAAYTLACPDRKADDLRMQLKGNTTVINGETVLSTGIDGFGIRIQNGADNALIPVGDTQWIPFTVSSQPQLKAVPVKQSGVQLAATPFSASLTMVVDYQ